MDYFDRKWEVHKKAQDRDSEKREWVYGLYIKWDKILLSKPTWVNIWDLPGWTREKGESLEDTIKREFLEETWFYVTELNPTPLKVEEVKFYASDLDTYFDSTMYYIEILALWKQDKRHIFRSEIQEFDYIALSELDKKNTNNHHYGIISEYK
jgi:8-oxo-dGTP pyrophosphatase MutT (NUDIX family)